MKSLFTQIKQSVPLLLTRKKEKLVKTRRVGGGKVQSMRMRTHPLKDENVRPKGITSADVM